MKRVHPGAVIVSGIAFWMIQAGWYTAFGNAWIAAVGITPEMMARAKANPSPLPYIIGLVADIIIAGVIGHVTQQSGELTPARGAIVGFVLWGGILIATLATLYAFEMKPFSLLAINGGCALLGMLLSGVIVGAWTKKA